MPINWTTIYKKYKNKWVALKSDEKIVAAGGTSVKSAYSNAVNSG